MLIDKTTLRKEIGALPSVDGMVKKSVVMQIIGQQKSAYDVDQVIKELNDWSFNTNIDTLDGSSKNLDIIASKIAIDIVKHGGEIL